MSQIIIITDAGGRRYAYRNFNYWDKEKKAPRTRREYLGRVDEQGNIIPKKTRKGSQEEIHDPAPASETQPNNQLQQEIHELESRVATLERLVSTYLDLQQDNLKRQQAEMESFRTRNR